MKRTLIVKCTPSIVPLTAAILVTQGCSDEQKSGAQLSVVETADAGAAEKPSSAKAGGVNGTGAEQGQGMDAKADNTANSDGEASGDANADNMESSTPAEEPGLELAGSKLGHAGGFIDYDGDDLPDQLIGAPHAKRGERLGVALIHAGKANGWRAEPTATLTGDRDFGFAFANLGDVDGDGNADYAVGAPHGDAKDVALAGSVSVFAGGSQGKLLAKLGGAAAASKFGFSIAGGDFNGDGKADVVVGAPFHTAGPTLYQTGAVFVHFGPKLEDPQLMAANAAVKGLGWAIAAGDLNGDGLDDLAISATSSATVMVFYGRSDFKPLLASPDLVLTSKASGFGKSLAVVSDLSGDGHRELAIGAPTAVIGEQRDTGSVFLVMGHASASAVDLDATPAPHQRYLQLDGPGLLSRFGTAIASTNDLDGDGLPELAIGAPMADDGDKVVVGKVFTFASKDLATRNASHAKSFAGSVTYSSFGTLIASAANGQLLVGAPRSAADRGAVHLVDATQGTDVHFETPVSDADAGVEGEHDDHH